MKQKNRHSPFSGLAAVQYEDDDDDDDDEEELGAGEGMEEEWSPSLGNSCTPLRQAWIGGNKAKSKSFTSVAGEVSW